MDQHEHPDPFAGLEEWARKTERRVRRETRLLGFRRTRGDAPGRGARYLRLLLAFTVAGVLLAAAIPVLRSWMPASVPQASPASAVSGTETVTVTTLAGPAPADPFVGTPAAGYRAGEAGITLPRAVAVDGFRAGEVETALRRVRAVLIASRLAEGMLVGHEPARFLALLAPGQRAAVEARFRAGSFSTLATWIDPTVSLDMAAPPRVSGRATYTSAVVGGVRTLQVTTNFVWVYAFQAAGRPLAAVHDEIRWDFPSPAGRAAADRGMRVGETRGYLAWADCNAAGRGMVAPSPNRAAIELLRADHPIETPDACP
ncbi:MAG TPA: hypothetical protein VGB74_12095 [Actinoplanes sp.]|jgi:hypothetical protein